MRIYATKGFITRKDRPDDVALRTAIREIEAGLVDARLGGELVKKRVAGKGKGKRGGYRTIIAVRSGERAVFLHCFAKNEREAITARELTALKRLADEVMGYTDEELDRAVRAGALVEVASDDDGTEQHPGLGA